MQHKGIWNTLIVGGESHGTDLETQSLSKKTAFSWIMVNVVRARYYPLLTFFRPLSTPGPTSPHTTARDVVNGVRGP